MDAINARKVLNYEAQRLVGLLMMTGQTDSAVDVTTLNDKQVCNLIMWTENDLEAHGILFRNSWDDDALVAAAFEAVGFDENEWASSLIG